MFKIVLQKEKKVPYKNHTVFQVFSYEKNIILILLNMEMFVITSSLVFFQQINHLSTFL